MGDIISFGVAPALLIYGLVLNQFGIAGMVMTVLFISCGALRLARFNVMDTTGYFVGLPITAAGTLVTFVALFAANITPVFFMFLVPVLAIFMVSTFTLKKI